MKQNGGEYAFEEVLPGIAVRGRERARASAVISCSDAAAVEYLEGCDVKEITAFYNKHDSYN